MSRGARAQGTPTGGGRQWRRRPGGRGSAGKRSPLAAACVVHTSTGAVKPPARNGPGHDGSDDESDPRCLTWCAFAVGRVDGACHRS